MHQPLVSVILPVFRSEKYLSEALDSLILQTYPHLEILAIYDECQDRSYDILSEYSAKDKRIQIVHGPNTNLIDALNAGLKIAKGALIARFDSDDICTLDRFEKQVQFLQTHDVDFCAGHAHVINSVGKKIDTFLFPTQSEVFKYTFLIGVPFCHGSILFKRALFDQGHFLYDRAFPAAEDYGLWVKLAMNREVKMANLDEFIYYYREHADSISKNKMKLIYADSARLMKIYQNYLDSNKNSLNFSSLITTNLSSSEQRYVMKILWTEVLFFAKLNLLPKILNMNIGLFQKIEGFLRACSLVYKYKWQ